MCTRSVLVNFGCCLAMYRQCSRYTPTITYLNFNMRYGMYSTNWIQRVSLVFLGRRTTSHWSHCSSMSNLHLRSQICATLQWCFINQHQTTDWVPMEGSWITQNIMSSNMLKFAITVRENFDYLQILSSPSKRKPEIIEFIEFIEFISKCSVLRTLTQKQSIRLSGRVGVLPGELCIAQKKMTRNTSKLTFPCYLLHFAAKPVLCWILELKCAICTVHRLLKHNRVGSK